VQRIPHILVVNGDQNLRHTLEIILWRAEFSVQTAECIQEAYQYFKEGSYDVLIIDGSIVEEGRVSGFLNFDRLCPDTAILMLANHEQVEHFSFKIAHSRFVYLTKPIDPDFILNAVNQLINIP
jgi:DNA-binding NtrC family response regulator